MNVDKRTTISLSESEVKSILAEYLSVNGYKVSPKNVKLCIGHSMVGDPPLCYTKEYFERAVVVIKED